MKTIRGSTQSGMHGEVTIKLRRMKWERWQDRKQFLARVTLQASAEGHRSQRLPVRLSNRHCQKELEIVVSVLDDPGEELP